jgi:hypothetical protein
MLQRLHRQLQAEDEEGMYRAESPSKGGGPFAVPRRELSSMSNSRD